MPNVPATTPIRTPSPVVRMTGSRRSATDRKVPMCATPARSSRSAVRTSPSKPWSMLWLDAVVQPSKPKAPIHAAASGGAAKTGKFCGGWPGAANGTSSWHSATSAPVTRDRTPANIGSKS